MIHVFCIFTLSLIFYFPADAFAYLDPNTGGFFGPFFFQTIAPYVYGVLLIIPWWTIFKKAGYSGAWSLIMVIPIINIIAMFIFAFSSWPILKKSSVD